MIICPILSFCKNNDFTLMENISNIRPFTAFYFCLIFPQYQIDDLQKSNQSIYFSYITSYCYFCKIVWYLYAFKTQNETFPVFFKKQKGDKLVWYMHVNKETQISKWSVIIPEAVLLM